MKDAMLVLIIFSLSCLVGSSDGRLFSFLRRPGQESQSASVLPLVTITQNDMLTISESSADGCGRL